MGLADSRLSYTESAERSQIEEDRHIFNSFMTGINSDTLKNVEGCCQI